MNKEEEKFVLIQKWFILVGGILIGVLLAGGLVSAWPYSINISTGEIVDLNVSNNETANLTIYIYNYTTNFTNATQTYYNITNVTVTNYTLIDNITCVNCTNNYTNITEQDLKIYNYTIQDSNGTYYNKTQTDNVFVSKTDFQNNLNNVITGTNTANSNLNTSISAINNTVTDMQKKNKNRNIPVWIGIIVAILIAIVAFYRASGGGQNE